jgi:crossover junction endodeoxyribonuclease RusA
MTPHASRGSDGRMPSAVASGGTDAGLDVTGEGASSPAPPHNTADTICDAWRQGMTSSLDARCPVCRANYTSPFNADGSPVALVVTAYGKPAMQGSKRHVGRGIMVESSSRTRPWRENVRTAVRAEIDATGWHRLTGPVEVAAVFFFDRPRSHYRTGRNADQLRDGAPEWPANRASGDVDKQLRLLFDAAVDAGALADDAQVVSVRACKRWTGDGLDVAGVRVEIRPAETNGET